MRGGGRGKGSLVVEVGKEINELLSEEEKRRFSPVGSNVRRVKIISCHRWRRETGWLRFRL